MFPGQGCVAWATPHNVQCSQGDRRWSWAGAWGEGLLP